MRRTYEIYHFTQLPSQVLTKELICQSGKKKKVPSKSRDIRKRRRRRLLQLWLMKRIADSRGGGEKDGQDVWTGEVGMVMYLPGNFLRGVEESRLCALGTYMRL